MNDDQITALAREYAEEYTKKKYPNAPGHIRERIGEGRLEHIEDFIPWLLRRFCLVEKSKVETKNKESLAALESNDNEDVKWGTYRLSLLKSLFPEIGKEVEE